MKNYSVLQSKERLIISTCVTILGVLTVFDVIEDLGEGSSPYRVIGDIGYMSLMCGLLFYIWRHQPLTTRRRNEALTVKLKRQHSDTQKWRDRAATLLHGLGKVIDQQFRDWKLSKAEREVALFLLKGLSLKEIAAIRESGDPTVRQQAASIYQKAHVSGRAELSAFFLEDLLLPNSAEND